MQSQTDISYNIEAPITDLQLSVYTLRLASKNKNGKLSVYTYLAETYERK
jgi:hypothetical protein